MYKPFQGATLIPLAPQSESFSKEGVTLPLVDTALAKDTDGNLWLSVVNVHPTEPAIVVLPDALNVIEVQGDVLTADQVTAANTFSQPNQVGLTPVRFTVSDNTALAVSLPEKSVAVLRLVTAN